MSFLSLPSVGPLRAAAVIVPAHDEGHAIEACLHSVLAALDSCPAALDAHVVVACDRCTDDTVARAQRTLGSRGSVLSGRWNSVGLVRAAGVAHALGRWDHHDPTRVWLANTDADTVVAEDWLTRQLALAAGGFAAVAGVVELDTASERLAQRFRAVYEIAEDGSHDHVHGANLGLRADAYLDCGGWPALALAEDHALLAQLTRRGWPTIATDTVRVRTSSRLHGRAPGGFADTLRSMLGDRAADVTAGGA